MKFKVGGLVERLDHTHVYGMTVGDIGVVARIDGTGFTLKGRHGWFNGNLFKLVNHLWIDAFGVTHATRNLS